MSLSGRRFVWLLAPPWDNVPTRQNHFARRLARLGAEVLYVENPSAWSSVLKQRRWAELPAGKGAAVAEIEPGLHVMRPSLSVPGGKHSDFVAELNGRLIAGQVRAWTRSRGWTGYDCWCRIPYSLFPLRHLDPAQTIYDITDDYELYESSAHARRKVREREEALLERVDHVFITTAELRQKKSIEDASPRVVPNGVEIDLFARASQAGEVHPLVAAARQPVIGYVGLTSHWMDFELLEMLGRRWPGQIVMLGPIAAQVEARARAVPGIVWGGFVPQHALGPYLRGFAVCIMPHLVNELRRRSNPLKICEYLATGKPFVSVDLPALNAFRELIDVAHDREEFVALVEKNLQRASEPAMVARRQAAARAFSWDTIFADVLDQLQPRLRAAA